MVAASVSGSSKVSSSTSSAATSFRAFMLRLSFPSLIAVILTFTVSPSDRTAAGVLIRFSQI